MDSRTPTGRQPYLGRRDGEWPETPPRSPASRQRTCQVGRAGGAPGGGGAGGAATTGRVWEPARPASWRNLLGNRHWVPGTMGKLVVLTLLGVGLALLGERFVALR